MALFPFPTAEGARFVWSKCLLCFALLCFVCPTALHYCVNCMKRMRKAREQERRRRRRGRKKSCFLLLSSFSLFSSSSLSSSSSPSSSFHLQLTSNLIDQGRGKIIVSVFSFLFVNILAYFFFSFIFQPVNFFCYGTRTFSSPDSSSS